MEKITVSSENENYASVNGVLFNKQKDCVEYYPAAKDGSFTWTKDLKDDLGNSYFNTSLVTRLIIDKDLPPEKFEKTFSALDHFPNVKEIVIDDNNKTGLKKMGNCIAKEYNGETYLWAFPPKGSDKLNIPHGITRVDLGMFRWTDVKKIALPDTVDYLEQTQQDVSIESISVDLNNKAYSSINGVVFSKDKKKLVLCPGGRAGKYTVPAGVEELGELSFRTCGRLTEVTMPPSVVRVDEDCFFCCKRLLRVNLSPNIKILPGNCFYGCKSLRSVEIPDGVAQVYDSAFSDCPMLTKIRVPAGADYHNNNPYFQTGASDLTIYCEPNSSAAALAKSKDINTADLSEYKPDTFVVPDFAELADVDNDGYVSSSDSLSILRSSVGLESYDENRFFRADVDFDGSLSANDALEALRVSIGLPYSIDN